MKSLIASLLICLGMLVGMSGPVLALDAKGSVQCGVNQVSGKTDCAGPGNGSTSIGSLLTKIIEIVSLLVGAIAVLMIIIGGFRYVTSAGSDSATAAARKTIIYALVGLVVAATAQIIVHFVLNNIVNT